MKTLLVLLAALTAIAACQPADAPSSGGLAEHSSCTRDGPPCDDGLACCPGAISGVPPMPGQSAYQDYRCKPAPCPPAVPMP